jgi:hypothetical protein
METRSDPAGSGEGTITRAIARTETLVRLFQIDTTLDVVRGLLASDPRREPLLKYWQIHRDQLARLMEVRTRKVAS